MWFLINLATIGLAVASIFVLKHNKEEQGQKLENSICYNFGFDNGGFAWYPISKLYYF
jgi:hypothetical protein